MLRPKREDNNPQLNFFRKFARIFTLLMTLVYVGLGLFVMFGVGGRRLNIDDELRYTLGGILILYGAVRFIRAYQRNKRNRDNGYEE